MKGMTGKVCTGVCELLNPTVKRGNASEDINGPVAPQAPDVHPSEGGSAMTQEPEVPTVAAALIKCGAARAVGLARNQRRKKLPREKEALQTQMFGLPATKDKSNSLSKVPLAVPAVSRRRLPSRVIPRRQLPVPAVPKQTLPVPVQVAGAAEAQPPVPAGAPGPRARSGAMGGLISRVLWGTRRGRKRERSERDDSDDGRGQHSRCGQGRGGVGSGAGAEGALQGRVGAGERREGARGRCGAGEAVRWEEGRAGPAAAAKERWRVAGCGEKGTAVGGGKRFKRTSEYIYEELFLSGNGSDIKIRALGKEWNLHKVYLCQSGYFSSMFSGHWRESSMDTIELEISDENIDAEALHVAFSSLYQDDVSINPEKVVAILAAASMLQLDNLMEQCAEIMKETINAETVCDYYNSAEMYGLPFMKKKCLKWLLNNLITHPRVEVFKEISINLMEQLISSSNLLVMQVEIDVYSTLKKWMFLQLVPSWNGTLEQLLSEADAWFAQYRKDFGRAVPFLSSEQGKVFQSVFRRLRLQYIINDVTSAGIIDNDYLIPPAWLCSIYKQQWLTMLRTYEGSDIGPEEISEETLEEKSMRCGRVLEEDGEFAWSWSGFNFGFDLLVIYTNQCIVFKRNTLDELSSGSVSLQPMRNVAFRLSLACFDDDGTKIFKRTTGYQILSFGNDEEQVVINFLEEERRPFFPLYISCNFQYTTPEGGTTR
ncbi:germ cell-less protein-like 1 [Cuculus canorus]|uniref:germ cell-less protein-like 1 n=1 Tax=Cuculus canorus TaxID=55661 RepID=UPI0023AB31AF|nr:germ cell-less protein-like 1 [Cuculus canorus]